MYSKSTIRNDRRFVDFTIVERKNLDYEDSYLSINSNVIDDIVIYIGEDDNIVYLETVDMDDNVVLVPLGYAEGVQK